MGLKLKEKRAREKANVNWYDSSRQYSNWSSELDSYMQQLYSQYGNTDWWTEFSSNPYLNIARAPVEPDTSFWRDMRDTYHVEAYKRINEILQKIREQNYNEPIGQVNRERVAGINSDLAGNVDPNEATPGTELPSVDLPSNQDFMARRLEVGSTIAQGGLQFVQTILGVVGGIQGAKTASLTNTGLELSLLGSGDNAVADFLVNRMPPPSKDSDDDSKDFMDYFNESLKLFRKDYPMSRKSRKVFDSILNSLRAGTDETDGSIKTLGKYEELANALITNRKGRAKSMSDPFFSDDFKKMLSGFSENYSELSYNIWKKEQEVQGMIADFQKDYYKYLNAEGAGTTAASLENEQNINALTYETTRGELGVPKTSAEAEDLQLKVSKLQADINKQRLDTIDAAETEFKKIQDKYLSGDKWYHILGRIALPILREFVTKAIGQYFDAAASSLGQRTFEMPPVPRVTNNNMYYSSPSF